MALATFYLHDPQAPRPNRPTHYGVNALVEWEGKLLLERRRDTNTWGLIGGGIKGREVEEKAMARELWEETGIYAPAKAFRKLKVFGDRDRIAAYPDGSVWRMVVVLYHLVLEEEPQLRISAESRQLRFFTREELKDIPVICTHQDMVEQWLG